MPHSGPRFDTLAAPARRLAALAALLWIGPGCGASGDGERAATGGGVPAEAVADTSRLTGQPATDTTGDPAGNTSSDTAGAALDASGRNVDSLVAAIRACPRDGLWHVCSLENRLRQFGLRAVERDTLTFIPGLSQPARTWDVGGRSLRVVLLDDAGAALVAATFDSARAAPRDDPSVVWPERVTLLHNANLLALYFGGSDRQVERISNLILGGPPQPERDH